MSTSTPFKSLQALANLTALLETNKMVILLPSPDGSQGTLETLGNISIADFKNFILAQVNQEILDLQNKPGNGAFASPINFNLTGPVTGTVAFDGSGDVTLPVAIADGALSIAMVSGLGTQLVTLQSDLDGKFDSALLGVAGGAASLDSNGLVPTWQLPSYVDDVIDAVDFASLPATGETGKIYVTADTGNIYRWSGSTYVWINNSVSSADTATRWATPRTLALGGVLSGSVPIDGSSDVNLTATLVDGSIGNVKLQHSSITLGTTPINLGDTVTSLTGLTSVSATTFVGALTGNAATATKWANAITLTLGGVLSGSVLIDGSGNVTLSASMPDDAIATSAVFGLDSALAGKLDSGATAVAAAKWAAPMTLTVTGPATGSVSFDGSAAVSLALTIADNALSQSMVSGLTTALSGLQSNINAKLDSSLYTAADVLTKLLTVDGTGSGLDADLLDGQSAAFYLNADNLNAGTIPAARAWALTGDVTSVANSVNTTIAAKAVTLAKMADLPANTLIGRQSDTGGVPQAIAIGTGLTLTAGVLSSSAPIPTDPQFNSVTIGADTDILLYESSANTLAVRAGPSSGYYYFTFGADGSFNLSGTVLKINGKTFTVDGSGNLAFNMSTLYNSAGFSLAVGANYWNYNTDGSLTVPGNIKLPNGSGLVSNAGASIKTGTGGASWAIQRAAVNTNYLTLADETGTAQWTWGTGGDLTTTHFATLGMVTVNAASSGYVTLNPGNANRPGYIAFFTAEGTRRGYLGWSNGAFSAITLTMENGWQFEIDSVTNIITSGQSASLTLTDTNATYGVGLKMTGNGTTTPSKYLRVINGQLQVVNDAYNAVIVTIMDDGRLDATRLTTGYDSGIANSVNCSNWFRSSGNTGWYSATYGGGIYMTDSTYVRTYNGKAMVASDFVISSDARLKTAVMPFQYKGRLRPVNYTLIENGKSGFGFIAQEVQELYPEAVGVIPETGMLQVSYSKLTAILAHQINALEDEFAKLRREVDALHVQVHRPTWWKRLIQRLRKVGPIK